MPFQNTNISEAALERLQFDRTWAAIQLRDVEVGNVLRVNGGGPPVLVLARPRNGIVKTAVVTWNVQANVHTLSLDGVELARVNHITGTDWTWTCDVCGLVMETAPRDLLKRDLIRHLSNHAKHVAGADDLTP